MGPSRLKASRADSGDSRAQPPLDSRAQPPLDSRVQPPLDSRVASEGSRVLPLLAAPAFQAGQQRFQSAAAFQGAAPAFQGQAAPGGFVNFQGWIDWFSGVFIYLSMK